MQPERFRLSVYIDCMVVGVIVLVIGVGFRDVMVLDGMIVVMLDAVRMDMRARHADQRQDAADYVCRYSTGHGTDARQGPGCWTTELRLNQR